MATNIEEIISCQKNLAEEIARLLRNFKKDGADRKTPVYLASRLAELEKFWHAFTEYDYQLKKSIAENHPYHSEQLYEKTHELYNTASELIKKHQEKISSDQEQPQLTTTTTTRPPIPTVHGNGISTAAIGARGTNTDWNLTQQATGSLSYLEASRLNNIPKLPPIKIPKFNGDFKEWKTFIDIFTNVIHNNYYISNVEKMQYLLYHLEGDARKVINHLQLTERNYNTALQLIKSRYNNNRKIITTYINTIIDAKKADHRSQEDIITLFDLIRECLEALKNLDCKTEDWGPIIVCIAMRKLDTESLRIFEESLSNPREMPSIDELLNFLEKRHQVLDCIKNSKQYKTDTTNKIQKRSYHAVLTRLCSMCGRNHNIYQCAEFKKLNVQDRQNFITQKKLCVNCLLHSKGEKCRSSKSCSHCKKKHHTLLHQNNSSSRVAAEEGKMNANTYSQTKAPQQPTTDAISYHVSKTRFPNVLLPTAIVRTKNQFGQTELFRALIDPGSQISLITEEAAQILKLQKQRIKATILGVGESESAKTYSKVSLTIQPRFQNTSISVEAFVLPKLNSLIPEAPTTGIDMNVYGNIVLADPTFDTPSAIDLLLGADIYANIITEGFKSGPPAAQNTKLGWILFGAIPNNFNETTKLSSFLSLAELDEKLEKFWEIEDKTSGQDDEECEKHFKNTHKRDEDGRYVVRLPFKPDVGQLGQSRSKALARLIQMEKKLKKNPNEMFEYNKFLSEYLELGHMSPAILHIGDHNDAYYLPHHAVFKHDSTTTKLRVVFDGSSKTDSGLSLNDLLYTGPKLQQELTQILLRWRKHRYVYTADIEKMFRQIKLHEEDKKYQKILWRQNPKEPINEYVLNTVTYGTYIDDMLTGADSRIQARLLQKEIIELLKKAGFNLRKWTSNDEELLKDIPENIRETGILEIKEDDTIKALGIHWNPKHDEFQFKLKLESSSSTLTKRILLSKIATIFDPMGWLAPVTFTAKTIMQSLWKAGTDWDQQPPKEIINAWEKMEKELRELEAIRIPRWIKHRSNNEIQIHGFCDASEKGYAAVVYSRTIDSFGKVHTTLLTAKTKVAPLKQKITLPRLELCGALLLAQLLHTTVNALEMQSYTLFAWCDSEITLAWIAKNPNIWNTFVANRVSEIQSLVPKNIWRHVSSQENPADIASRGINPTLLISCNLWWRGPLWLSKPPEAWPSNKCIMVTSEEIKRTMNVLTTTTTENMTNLLTCSSYTRQIRVIAYCRRFISNSRLTKVQRKVDYLTTEELQDSKTCILKMIQRESFNEEVEALQKKRHLKKSSKILSLHPFLDRDGILRVGGRVQNSNLSPDAKHQVLLPQKHHLTNIIIEHAHRQTLHGGTQLTLNYIRMQFWIINAKNIVQSRNHRCITCLRHRQNSNQQLMGNLPTVRITPSPPFSHCGIDYAGPFITKISKGRSTKTTKGYVALFICMVTKAVHLELVSDLTTDAFLAAYKRFVARRGNCKQIYSDNGTNFVGARNKMEKDLQLAINSSTKQAAEIIANDGTDWKFIPAASPHFGGLWEAGVKSVKGHLKRVLGETLLTYEEFTTVLHQVEACLNSRPIGQQSSDPTDLEPLTPGHFLIGRALIAPPEPDISCDNHIHQRWKLVTKLQQDIWKRWSQEYLTLLQQRSKWKAGSKNPSVGELVLVMDDNLPPQKWSLGRIFQLHPGEDGVVRIVSVKYKNNIKKRPVNKLAQLPINIHGPSDVEPDTVSTMTVTVKPSKHTHRKTPISIKHEVELWSKPEHFHRIKTQRKESKESLNSISEPPVKKRKIKIAPCTWASKLLHSTLLILYWLTLVFAQDYELLQPKSGLFLENLGQAQIKRGNLRLQIPLPPQEILNDKDEIDKSWNKINKMCQKTKQLTYITHCETLFRHLSLRRTNLLKTTDEIIEITQHKNRKRRGLLGKLLTSVFGVNDEVYTDIEALQKNQQDLLKITNQETLLLNTKINQSNNAVMEKLKQFDTRLSQVVSSVNEMNTWFTKADHNRISIEVVSTYLSAEDYYEELQEKYSRWLNAIHNHGHLLDFISLHDIKNVIENITARIGTEFFISRIPQQRLDIKIENNTITLHGYLNIIENNMYELIHVTPTPQRINNNTFAITDLKTSTFAINFNQQTYFNLEEQELKSCTITSDHVYLCTPSIVHNIEENPSCIIDAIYARHVKTQCEIRQIQLTGTVWKLLMNKNTWLFITTNPVVVAVICKGVRTDLLLNNTGIIHLKDDCFIKTREATLKTTLDQSMDVVSSHIKETTPEAAVITFNQPPLVLKAGALIRTNEQLVDYSMPLEQPHLKFFRRTMAIHSVITSSSVLLCLILVILAYKYRASFT